jgi:putative glutamine amidotransferase
VPVSTPLIAVVGYRLPFGRVSGWRTGGYGVPQRYVEAIGRAGANSAVVPPQAGDGPSTILDRFDGLLLAGGGDVAPERYGADRHDRTYGEDAERDAFEDAMVRHATDAGVPTLAICRGIQVLNVALGGTLIQHVPDVPGTIAHGEPVGGEGALHRVKVSQPSRLAGASRSAELVCASHHHQAVDRLGHGLTAVGWSEDGLVEAVEFESGWTVGVQWHPETTAADDPAQQGLFDALVARARARAGA